MRISDFIDNIYSEYEFKSKNKTTDTNKSTCISLTDMQNNSNVSIVINIDLSNDRQTNEIDESTRKLYRNFYRVNSY